MSRVFFPWRGRGFLAGAILCLLCPVPGAALAAAPPTIEESRVIAPVEKFHAVLLQVMREAAALGPEGRRSRIDPQARATFDFARMARLIAGPTGRAASEAQQARFAEAFAALSIATYASRFKGWSGQSFETLGTESGPRGTTLVLTRINTPQGEPVALTYVVVTGDDGAPRVTDILLKGSVSELSVKRSEYAALLQAGDLDALSAALEKQAQALLAP